MATYVVSADVHGRDIEWEFGNGREALRFWRAMKDTGKTPDTDQPVGSASLIRDGRTAERFTPASS